MRKLINSRYIGLAVIAALWAVSIYLRAPVMHTWESAWPLWMVAHDLLAGSFAYQLAQINKASDRRKQKAELLLQLSNQSTQYGKGTAHFADKIDAMLENDRDNNSTL